MQKDFSVASDFDPLGRLKAYVEFNFAGNSLPFCGIYRDVSSDKKNLLDSKGEGS